MHARLFGDGFIHGHLQLICPLTRDLLQVLFVLSLFGGKLNDLLIVFALLALLHLLVLLLEALVERVLLLLFLQQFAIDFILNQLILALQHILLSCFLAPIQLSLRNLRRSQRFHQGAAFGCLPLEPAEQLQALILIARSVVQ
jgi:hypothetical protein